MKNIKIASNRFVSVQLTRSPSGTCASSYGIIILLDVTRKAFIHFFNFNAMDCNDGKATSCKASFYIKNNHLEIRSSKRKHDGLFCIKSGKYTFKNDKIIKLKK